MNFGVAGELKWELFCFDARFTQDVHQSPSAAPLYQHHNASKPALSIQFLNTAIYW